MARVGEGDPRWIVNERKDGQNVNAWHWEERDLTNECHGELKRRFENLELCSEDGTNLRIKEVSEISGDVTVAQRKGKMMCYFELKMTLKWAGGDKISGSLTVPEVDHDTFREEYDITVSVTENDAASQKAEALVRSNGRAVVRDVISGYFNELFEVYQIGKSVKNPSVLPPPQTTMTKGKDTGSAQGNERSDAARKQHLDAAATSFSWNMRWRIPIEELFTALMNEQRASVYTRSPAKIDPRSGGTFEFLGGVITGYFVEVVPNELIKMQWRLGSWPSGIHSSVVMSLKKEEPGVTRLEFAQVGIPEGELQSVQEGWKMNFFNAIKMVFGYSMDYI